MTAPLTTPQREALRASLVPFADRIERIDLYGSRARGDHRPGSDIDLLVIGDVDAATLLAIAAAIEASALSIHADVTVPPPADSALAAAIAREARPLFDRRDLTL